MRIKIVAIKASGQVMVTTSTITAILRGRSGGVNGGGGGGGGGVSNCGCRAANKKSVGRKFSRVEKKLTGKKPNDAGPNKISDVPRIRSGFR